MPKNIDMYTEFKKQKRNSHKKFRSAMNISQIYHVNIPKNVNLYFILAKCEYGLMQK